MSQKKSNPLVIFIGFIVVAVLVTVGVVFAVNYTPPATPAQKAAANAGRAIYDLQIQISSVGRLATKNSGNTRVQSMGSEIDDFCTFDKQPLREWIQSQRVHMSETVVDPSFELQLDRGLVQQMSTRRSVGFDSLFLSYLGKVKKRMAAVEASTKVFETGKAKTYFDKLQAEISGAYGMLGGQG